MLRVENVGERGLALFGTYRRGLDKHGGWPASPHHIAAGFATGNAAGNADNFLLSPCLWCFLSRN